MAVEHRLHLAPEREAAPRAVPFSDLRRCAGQGGGAAGGRALVARLVAAGARDLFAGHRGHPTAHELQRVALLVERLHRHGRVGGHLEVGRAVGLHRHGADDLLDVPRAVEPHAIDLPAHALVGEVIGKEAELLHRAAGHACQAGAGIHVRQVHGRVLLLRLHARGDDRRAGPGLQRHRLQQGLAGQLLDQRQVVEHVGQVESPRRAGARLARDEEERIRERPGVEELRPRGLGEVVADHRLHRFATPRDALHDPVG